MKEGPSSEKINKGLSPEQIKAQQEKEDQEWLDAYFVMHPEIVIAPEDLREAGPEIAKFEEMILIFESTYSLVELNAIINITAAESATHRFRESARVALAPIVAMLDILEKETNISPRKHNELKEKYKKLSRAVGVMNNNKIDHNR